MCMVFSDATFSIRHGCVQCGFVGEVVLVEVLMVWVLLKSVLCCVAVECWASVDIVMSHCKSCLQACSFILQNFINSLSKLILSLALLMRDPMVVYGLKTILMSCCRSLVIFFCGCFHLFYLVDLFVKFWWVALFVLFSYCWELHSHREAIVLKGLSKFM